MNYNRIGESIVERLMCGDENAFETIYEHYKGRVYSLSIKYTKSKEDSEDIVSKLFVDLWGRRDQIKDARHLQNWLFKVGLWMSLKFVRGKRPTAELTDEITNTLSDYGIGEDTLDREVIRTEMIEILFQGIQSLPPVQKKVFEMSCLKHIPHKDIAQALGISIITVYNHLVRARKKLRIIPVKIK